MQVCSWVRVLPHSPTPADHKLPSTAKAQAYPQSYKQHPIDSSPPVYVGMAGGNSSGGRPSCAW